MIDTKLYESREISKDKFIRVVIFLERIAWTEISY